MKLILVRGLPGSGKTTYVKNTYPNFVHLEADHYRTDCNGNYFFDSDLNYKCHSLCYAYAEMALSEGRDVVVANTFVTLREMKPYIQLAEDLRADLKVVVCRGNFGNVHDVPEETISRMAKRWQEYPGETKAMSYRKDKPICFGMLTECGINRHFCAEHKVCFLKTYGLTRG